MKKDLFFIIYLVVAALIVLCDLGYLAFLVLEYFALKNGTAFVSPYFQPFFIAALTINGVLILLSAAYFTLKKLGKL